MPLTHRPGRGLVGAGNSQVGPDTPEKEPRAEFTPVSALEVHGTRLALESTGGPLPEAPSTLWTGIRQLACVSQQVA